jgi:hypothetical protein
MPLRSNSSPFSVPHLDKSNVNISGENSSPSAMERPQHKLKSERWKFLTFISSKVIDENFGGIEKMHIKAVWNGPLRFRSL